MNIAKIEPNVANEILQIESVVGGNIIDDAIYISPNEVIRIEATKAIFKFNYNNMSDVWKAHYLSAYEAFIAGDPGTGLPPGDPNEFYIDTYIIIFGPWRIYYLTLTALLAIINTDL